MKFDCRNCKDSCCKKKVALNVGDLRRISDNMDANILDFIQFRGDIKGARVKGNSLEGVMTFKEVDGHCYFLKDGLCEIYEFRPLSCRIYPYNPIFNEHKKNYDLKITTNNCKELKKGRSFPVKQLALRWRKERLEYDKIVRVWNEKEDRNLLTFIISLVEAIV